MVNEKMLAENLRKKFKPQFDVLENYSALAQHRSITESDVLALGRQLEQIQMWEEYVKEAAANNVGGFASDLGALPKKALDIVTAAYGTSVIPELCSVQPIDEEQGIVWYKEIVTKSDRGNMSVNDSLFHAQEMPEKYPNGYAAAKMQEYLGAGDYGQLDTTDTTVTKAVSGPVRPHSVKIIIQKGAVANGAFAVESTLAAYAVDDGKGAILGNQIGGSIDYETGAITLTFFGDLATEVGTADKIRPVAIFEQDFEKAGNSQIGAIQYELTSKFVQAQVFALTESLGLLKSYSMQKRFGKSAEDEMINDLINTLTLEVGGSVLTDMITGCRAYRPRGATADYVNSVTYNTKSYQVPILAVQTLAIKINEAAQKIYAQSGRGEGNIICATPDACTQLAVLEGFKPSNISIQGPHVFGTLGNVTVIRVPHRVPGFEKPNTCMVVYKGTGDFDAPAVYSPFMPLYVSGSIPILNNPLMKQGVVCTWAGITTTCPQFLTEINFSNTYNPEEQFPTWNTPPPVAP